MKIENNSKKKDKQSRVKFWYAYEDFFTYVCKIVQLKYLVYDNRYEEEEESFNIQVS